MSVIKKFTKGGFPFKRKDMCSSPHVRAPKLQLLVEQPSIGGCWNPPKKKKNDTPGPKTKK